MRIRHAKKTHSSLLLIGTIAIPGTYYNFSVTFRTHLMGR
jgi:hypothetical protein